MRKVVKKNESRVPYYPYEPKAIIEEGDYKVYWDRTIRTDKEEIHNRPVIIVYNKVKKKVQLTDIAIPFGVNMKNTYNEKKRKYEELARQIRRMWKVETTEIIPIVISSTGLVPAEWRNNVNRLDVREYVLRNMRKVVLIVTSDIIRGVLGEL